MIKILLISYFSIGILLAFIGPAKNSIAKGVEDVKKTAALQVRPGQSLISNKKIILFRLIITIGFILFWPFFLSGILKDNNKQL